MLSVMQQAFTFVIAGDCTVPFLEYGKVAISKNLVGAVAKFECKKGFKLEGSQMRQCLKSGEWTGVTAECNSKT